MFAGLFFAVSFLAGGVASLAGFGIGSLLTPLLATKTGVKLAVAAVSIPHLAATATRFWLLRGHVDRRVLLTFGLASAAGGLAGAVLHSWLHSPALGVVLGALLVFSGISGLTGFYSRFELHGFWGWVAGVLSGVFGGLVGNQGGIRSAAMLGFDVPKEAFVATATATALLVDAARMPFYFWTVRDELVPFSTLIVLATAGTLIGTFAGKRLLERVPERLFRRILSALILALGIALLCG
jgi:uncharacterized membrane protein YfcA